MSLSKPLTSKHTLTAACIGYIVQAVVNNLSPLFFAFFSGELGISLTKLSLLITVNFVLQICTDLFGSLFIDRIGYRKTVLFAEGAATVGLLLLSALPRVLNNTYLGILLPTILTAIGGGLIEVVVSPIVEAIPGDAKSSTMGLLHSFYCWGQAAVILFSTVFIGFFGIEKWYVLPMIWAPIPLLGFLLFTVVPIYTLEASGDEGKISHLGKEKLFYVIFILMICAGAAELGMAQWASMFAEVGLGISKALGDLLGPCAFAVLMGIGRLLYSKYGEKIGLERCITVAFALSVFGYLLTALSPYAFLSLVGCGICGFAAAPMWPATYSLGAKKIPSGGTAMFALLALGGDIGCMLGPDVVGLISDTVTASSDNILFRLFGSNASTAGLKAGMLFITWIPLIGLITMLLMNRKKAKKNKCESET